MPRKKPAKRASSKAATATPTMDNDVYAFLRVARGIEQVLVNIEGLLRERLPVPAAPVVPEPATVPAEAPHPAAQPPA